MAGVKFSVSSGEVSYSTSAKTGLQIKAAANQRTLVRGFIITGKAAAGGTDQPCKLRITRSTANFGTATTSPAIVGKFNPSDGETIQTSTGYNFSAEPTSPTDDGLYFDISPQGGLPYFFPADSPLEIPGGQARNFELTCPAAQTFTITVICEE